MKEEIYQRVAYDLLNERWDDGMMCLTDELRSDPLNSEITGYLTEMAFLSDRTEEAVVYGLRYRELKSKDVKENTEYKLKITHADIYGYLMNAYIKLGEYNSANEMLWEIYNAFGCLTTKMVYAAIVLEKVFRGNDSARTLAEQYRESYKSFPDADEYIKEINEALIKLDDPALEEKTDSLINKWNRVKENIWKDPDEAEDILSLMASWEAERYILRNQDKDNLKGLKALRDINSGTDGDGAELFRTYFGGSFADVLNDVEKSMETDLKESADKLLLAYVLGTKSSISGDKASGVKAEKLLEEYAAEEDGKEYTGSSIYPMMWYYLASFVDYGKPKEVEPAEEPKPMEETLEEIKPGEQKKVEEPKHVEKESVKDSFIIADDENINWIDNEEHTSVVLTDKWIYIKPSGMEIQAVKLDRINAYQLGADGLTLYADGFEFGISVLSNRNKQSELIKLIKPIIG